MGPAKRPAAAMKRPAAAAKSRASVLKRPASASPAAAGRKKAAPAAKRPAASEGAAAPASLPEALRQAGDWELEHAANAKASREAPYPAKAQEAVSLDSVADASLCIVEWKEYKETRLVSLQWLAEACGVAEVVAKDESDRCGLTSFKALGGGLVVEDCVKKAVAEGRPAAEVTVATASAGNHGMGVAWGARRCGCRAVIYLGERVSEQIAEKMRGIGATVKRVSGSYEESLNAAKVDSEANGWHLVQDVSWDGYFSIPARISSGYGVVAAELVDQFAKRPGGPPTHVLVNAGVGGFACGVCGYLWHKLGAARPRFICVEPTAAPCVQHCSRTDGELTLPPNGLSTMQVGLDCREVSPIAWSILEMGVDDFVAVPDTAIGICMRLLAENEEPVVAGESGVAGLAVLLAAAARPELREKLRLDASSRVAVIVCEAPPNAELYEKMVGMPPDRVVAGAAA